MLASVTSSIFTGILAGPRRVFLQYRVEKAHLSHNNDITRTETEAGIMADFTLQEREK